MVSLQPMKKLETDFRGIWISDMKCVMGLGQGRFLKNQLATLQMMKIIFFILGSCNSIPSSGKLFARPITAANSRHKPMGG